MLTNQIKQLKIELIAKGELYLSLRIRPNAAETKIIDVLADNSLKIAVRAAPDRGKANQEVIKFLALTFDLPTANIKLISVK